MVILKNGNDIFDQKIAVGVAHNAFLLFKVWKFLATNRHTYIFCFLKILLSVKFVAEIYSNFKATRDV